MSIKGSGYLASPQLESSTANQELIPNKPSHWSVGYKLYKFSFNNKQATKVIINKETTAYLEAGQGFEMESGDAPIHSFVIVDSGIPYSFIGAY